MNRREFIQCAAILVGGTMTAANAFGLNAEQLQYLATAEDYIKNPAKLFSKQQRAIITAAAEIIMPRTDTPGASDANVARFIELMVQDWFNDQERDIFMAGLRDLEIRPRKELGKHYHRLSHAQQLQLLEDMEAQASDSAWYTRGNVRRAFISDAPFICQLKELTIWGFFTSEVGATQVLRYNAMPMKFDGNYARTATDTTWAPFNFYR